MLYQKIGCVSTVCVLALAFMFSFGTTAIEPVYAADGDSTDVSEGVPGRRVGGGTRAGDF